MSWVLGLEYFVVVYLSCVYIDYICSADYVELPVILYQYLLQCFVYHMLSRIVAGDGTVSGELRLRTYSDTAAAVRSSQQQYKQQQNVNSAPGSCRQQATHPHGTNSEPNFSGNTRGTRAHTTKLSGWWLRSSCSTSQNRVPRYTQQYLVDDLRCVLTLPSVEERTCKLRNRSNAERVSYGLCLLPGTAVCSWVLSPRNFAERYQSTTDVTLAQRGNKSEANDEQSIGHDEQPGLR